MSKVRFIVILWPDGRITISFPPELEELDLDEYELD